MIDEAASQDPQAPQDVRPLVARASGNRGMWIFGAVLLAGAGGMFYALQTRRLALENPSLVAPQPDAGGMITSPPELAIPAAPDFYASGIYTFGGPMQRPMALPPVAAAPYAPSPVGQYPAPVTPPSAPGGLSADGQFSPGAPVPGYAYQAPVQPAAETNSGASKTDDKRVEAGRLRNPSTTVPQGSVIQAIMETALDSTRAGFARAIVSHDVLSFDGTRVLVPKGSKLFGNYQADVSLGQNRALIQWRRLTRPDGAIIDLDSPSADPLGRAGIRGKVNTHFFERFGGAILQSMLDLGVRAATREAAGDTLVLALPSSTQTATTLQRSDDIKPTLKIRQGASISVFVARDLDFTAVGG